MTYYLYQYGKISLPQLGNFAIVRQAANYNAVDNRIAPGQFNLQHSAEYASLSKLHLLQYLADVGAGQIDNVEPILMDWVQDVVAKKQAGDLNNFLGFHPNILDSAIAQISSKVASLPIEDTASYWPIWHLRPKTKQTERTIHVTPTPEIKKRRVHLGSILGIVIICLFIASLIFIFNSGKKALPINEELVNIPHFHPDDRINVSPESIMISHIEDSTITQEQEDVISEDSTETTTEDPFEGKEFLYDCIIITGAFENPNNVIRMEKVLSDYNFPIYKDVYGSLIRVGMRIPCVNRETLEQIRREVSPDAWILPEN